MSAKKDARQVRYLPGILNAVGRTENPRSRHAPGHHPDRRGRDLIVEITLDQRLEWVPSGAQVVWDDGTRRLATIDAAGTTRHGVFHPGQVIRLALRLAKDGPVAPPARIVVGGGEITIVLHAQS